MANGQTLPELDHATNSVLRELIVEHLFIGEALRACWRNGIADVEVLRSETDSFGYDLVMTKGEVVRHIQLKTAILGGTTDEFKAGLRLLAKPSGCVICVVVTPGLDLDHYLWFGGTPGDPLPNISEMKIAKHTKANAEGRKSERPDHRVIRRNRFDRLASMTQVLEKLFAISLTA